MIKRVTIQPDESVFIEDLNEQGIACSRTWTLGDWKGWVGELFRKSHKYEITAASLDGGVCQYWSEL